MTIGRLLGQGIGAFYLSIRALMFHFSKATKKRGS
jgi:hypothetical protein